MVGCDIRKLRGIPLARRSNSATDDTADKKRVSLRPLASLLPYLRRYPYALAGGLAALLVSAAAMLAVPFAVRGMIDQGFSSSDGRVIDRWFLALMLFGVVLALASSSRVYIVNWLGERVVADLRSDVFRHVATLGPAFFERTHSGEVMSRLTADTTQLKSVAGSTLSQALRNAIMLIGALVMMVATSGKLSGLVLLAIPAIVLPMVVFGRVVQKRSRRAQDTLAEASAYASENLSAVRTMQAFAHEGVVADRFTASVERSFTAAKSRLMARAGLTALAIFLTVASITGVLWYGASSVVKGEISGGVLSQFLLYAMFAAGALAELAEVWGEMSQAAGSAERLTELLAVEPEIKSPPRPVALPVPARGALEFKAVRFKYPSRPDTSALEGVSFKIAPGETVALVGPSGSGKTTVFNLALRFYDPTQGDITLDGVSLREADIAAIRDRMALVPQDVALFADTVAENIRYGTKSASMDDIRKAATAAQAAEFIDALPQGYDTKLGERGVQLSGGQRQRLAIARAILKDAPILLLDEATSALDAENERLVQRALESVMKTRTTIVIAHRLATVQKADRILVLDKGRIIEEGRHADLVRRNGAYARLAELQFVQEAAE
jgi:ATP-binding cassette, subfamily B, bacterial